MVVGHLPIQILMSFCIRCINIYIYMKYKISKMSTPNIKPIELKEHTCKQGHYGDIAPNFQ